MKLHFFNSKKLVRKDRSESAKSARNKHLQGGGYKTGNMCGYKTGIMCGYKTNHSKKICAGMTAIRPINRKFLELCKRSLLRI